ncbi:MAG: alpha-glucan family phosphorylase, partial [Candidatus Omnitrophica bacterium]|nr:alpha-glucan family phosphorylase [Candidatus Omnitrophota bacterium]
AVLAFVEKARGIPFNELGALRERYVYTCHTPVEAGHDRFSSHDLANVLKPEDFDLLQQFGREETGMINLTLVSMNVSSSINAVSKNHQTVMKLQFPRYRERIQFVTNGVHPYSWISPEFYKVFKDFPDVFENIDENPMILQRALTLKDNPEFRSRIWAAHQSNKESLLSLLDKWQLGKNYFTLCWARRIAAYKRPSLLLNDINRLIGIAQRRGPIQIIIAGKAHPNDNLGFTYINEILDKVDSLTNVYDILKIIILENYDMYLGKMLTSGVDVWLNNPLPPFEASGTSGMKAILNGVVQVSTYDGWVVEAADKGIGKIFGYRNPSDKISPDMNLHMQDDAVELYRTMEETVDLYYKTNNNGVVDLSSEWIDMMINCVATGAYFNTYRMLDEYKELIWSPNAKVENPSLAR